MVNIDRNTVSEFYYASSLTAVAQAIVPAYGTTTAAVGKYKRVRITDLKVMTAGTACDIVIGGTNSTKKAMSFRVGTSETADFQWEIPYPIDCTSATAAVHMIYGSASGLGAKVIVSGYYDANDI